MLTILTTRYRVRRWTRQDCSGYQRLEWVVSLFGCPVFFWAIDQEDVPSWAYIQRACLGFTEWESRLFKQYSHLLENEKHQPDHSR